MGPTRKRVKIVMEKMVSSRGLERVLQFLQILGLLADSKDCHPIASPSFAASSQAYDEERMDHVFQFLINRMDQDIRLSDAAQLVHLSEGAFSRFFRTHTGKTFPGFVNDLRNRPRLPAAD